MSRNFKQNIASVMRDMVNLDCGKQLLLENVSARCYLKKKQTVSNLFYNCQERKIFGIFGR